MYVRDEGGDGASFGERWWGAPHGGMQALDEVLIDARARRVGLEQRVSRAQPVSFRHSAANGS